MDYTVLSELVSHALRHEPDEYLLQLDSEGWVEVNALLQAIKRRSSDWADLTEAHLRMMIQHFAKQRHEIRAGRIRALYGHSTRQRLLKDVRKPPEVLYHGTGPTAAQLILAANTFTFRQTPKLPAK